jgi:hypothetical protein
MDVFIDYHIGMASEQSQRQHGVQLVGFDRPPGAKRPSPHRQIPRIRLPCGDNRLRRESARTAPVGERRYRGLA